MTPLRAAFHIHSEWSYDADWPLDRLAAAFARRGYDVLLMSEHDRGFDQSKWDEYQAACREASGPALVVPGIEYSDHDNVVHLPVWGDLPFLGEGLPPLGLLEDVHGHGGTAIFAHPWRRDAWQRYGPEWRRYLRGVEVWNRKYDGVAPCSEAVALADRESLQPLVALDFHTRRQFFPLSVRLEADSSPGLSEVFDALHHGSFASKVARLPLDRVTSGAPNALMRGGERVRQLLRRLLTTD